MKGTRVLTLFIPPLCLILSHLGSCDTDVDAAILSLSVETSLSPPGRGTAGVVSANLQWALRPRVAEPAVEQRKVILAKGSVCLQGLGKSHLMMPICLFQLKCFVLPIPCSSSQKSNLI